MRCSALDGELDSAAAAEKAKVEKIENAILEFAQIDTNNDGLISPEEYVAYKSQTAAPAPEERPAAGLAGFTVIPVGVPKRGTVRWSASLRAICHHLAAYLVRQHSDEYYKNVAFLEAFFAKKYRSRPYRHRFCK